MKKRYWIMWVLVILLATEAISITLIQDKMQEWLYTRMGAQVNYAIGQRVTDRGRTYECIQWDEGSPLVMVPPEANPGWWAEVQ